MELSASIVGCKERGFVMSEVLLLLGLILSILFLGFFSFVPAQKEKLKKLNQERDFYDGIKSSILEEEVG